MDHVLLVTPTKKSADMLLELIKEYGGLPERMAIASSCSEGRRFLMENDFDLIVINAPMPDEFGHELAVHACQSSTAGVLMLVKSELSDSVSERVESDGVFVISKPVSRALFHQAVRLVNASRMRVYHLQKETRQLRQRLEDLRVIDRAKCMLIEVKHMTEAEAHTYIEKQAMNRRQTRRDVAEDILRIF